MACAIPDEDTVVITGGSYTQREVSRYNENGFLEYLPSLISHKEAHHCSWFINEERKRVNIIIFLCWLFGSDRSSRSHNLRSSVRLSVRHKFVFCYQSSSFSLRFLMLTSSKHSESSQSTQKALKEYLKSTQKKREQSHFIIPSEPKILRFV